MSPSTRRGFLGFVSASAAGLLPGRAEAAPVTADSEPRPWLVEQGLGFVEKYAGLRAVEIDHLVFGLKSEGFLPRVTVVVRTRLPYDPSRVAQAQAPVSGSFSCPQKAQTFDGTAVIGTTGERGASTGRRCGPAVAFS